MECYKYHSLKEGFKSLDTTLQYPYKECENAVDQRSNRASSNCEHCQLKYKLSSFNAKGITQG